MQTVIKIRVIDQTTVSLGQRMSECLEGFVSAVKALFPISTQTYHQEGKRLRSTHFVYHIFFLFSLPNLRIGAFKIIKYETKIFNSS